MCAARSLVMREAVARMATDRGGQGGAVVNVSSRAAELGGPSEWVHYAASKGALDTPDDRRSQGTGRRGIRVNAVSPGLIETDLTPRPGCPTASQRMAGGVPMGRAGTADEVAARGAMAPFREAHLHHRRDRARSAEDDRMARKPP